MRGNQQDTCRLRTTDQCSHHVTERTRRVQSS